MIASLKPGILVALRTAVRGGVEYRRTDLEPEAPEGTAAIERWETTRVVECPEEHERARAVRSAATNLIRRVCVATDFGLLCPEARESALDEATTAAKALADEHNRTAEHTRVDVYVMKGRIASSDEEAARGIAAEVRGLLDGMERGILAGDPVAVREAASRARKLEQVLDDAAAKKVGEAVSEARSAAREIARRVIDSGEAIETVVTEIRRERIETARFAFLDVDPVTDITEPSTPPPLPRQTELDLEVTS